MRLIPASSAAAQKLGNRRFTPGRPSDVVSNLISSVPKNSARTVAAAPLKLLCPDVYDGNDGVVRSGSQFGSGSVAGLWSLSASRIAWTGRQKWKWNLQSQQA